ncbi:hypothetical protein [Luteococcus sanguinis]|uniref:XRE family transcriptional regulator n=1 Tax=Luteococcus sanguinis TaxID=174038 RepID=A0ABW1X0R4_9ACTN
MPGHESFATLLTDAIRARGLTLERIRHRLDEMGITVSVATLSYWQNGRSQPTRANSQYIIAALEHVLEVPPGHLSSAAPAQPTRRRWRPAAAKSLPEVVEQLLQSQGLSAEALKKLSTHVSLKVGRDRTESSELVRNVVQCVADGTDRFPLVATVDRSAGEAAQTIEGLGSCRVGTVYEVPEHNLVLTEMMLPRPLRQGELVMYEYMTSWTQGHEPATALQLATSKLNELVLEVQFESRDLPRRIIGYSRGLDEDLGFETPDAVAVRAPCGLAQLVRLDVPVGIHSLLWEW